MLSEEEKNRIEAVETYKFEIKDKLETEKAKKFGLGKVFAFFNSKFGLWVLSAIFVSGGVKVYDDYKVKQQNEKTRGEIIEKLDNEISYKFDRVLVTLEQIIQKDSIIDLEQQFASLEEVKKFVLGINMESRKEEVYLYEEFKNWSLLALIVEQNRQLKHLGFNNPEIEDVIRQLNEMSKFFENKQVNKEDIKSIYEIISENLILNRWKSNSLFSD